MAWVIVLIAVALNVLLIIACETLRGRVANVERLLLTRVFELKTEDGVQLLSMTLQQLGQIASWYAVADGIVVYKDGTVMMEWRR